MRKLVILAASILAALAPAAAMAAPAWAEATVNCVYSPNIIGHPDMQYTCYIHHDDGTVEIFYAPGPADKP